MIIDFHTHVFPPEDFETFTGTGFHRNVGAKKGRPPATIENVLEAAKIGSVDISVISNPIHNLRDMDRAQQLARCRRQNRYNAEQQNKYSGKIYGMASIVPYGGDAFLREFERAVKQDGLKGFSQACRAAIPTTTTLFRFSNWRPNSTCRWSFTRRRSASARSACAITGWHPLSAGRWTGRWRWPG